MADVFKCELQGMGGFGKLCVLKRMKPELVSDDDFVNMFMDEARLAARLNHPNIVQVFEIDHANGVPFIAMELVRGPTVSKLFREAHRQNVYDVDLIVRVIADAALGLAAAHTAVDDQGAPMRIVHRDVSPQNLMTSTDGVTKVLDFGVAKAEGKLAKTVTGMLKGKLAYMAPEQVMSREVDQRADVFSLGVCLYQGCTGHTPFRGAGDIELLRARLTDEWKPAAMVRPDLPAVLDRIINTCLAANPDDRYQSALAMHDALEDFLGDRPAKPDQKAVAAWVARLFPNVDALIEGRPIDSLIGTSLPHTPLSHSSNVSSHPQLRGVAAASLSGATPRSALTRAGLRSLSQTPHTMTEQAQLTLPPEFSVNVELDSVSQTRPQRPRAALAAMVGAALLGTAAVTWVAVRPRSSSAQEIADAVRAQEPQAPVAAPAVSAVPAPVIAAVQVAPPEPEPTQQTAVNVAVPTTKRPAKVFAKESTAAVAVPAATPEPSPPAVESAPPPAALPPPVAAPPELRPEVQQPPPVAKAVDAAAENPELPGKARLLSVPDLIAECRKVEAQLDSRGHVPPALSKNVTAAMAKQLAAKIVAGDIVEIYPAGMYWYVVKMAVAGQSKSAIAAGLVGAQASGTLNGFRR